MTARQRKQQAKPLKRRRGDTTPTDSIHPEPPVFVAPDTHTPVIDGANLDAAFSAPPTDISWTLRPRVQYRTAFRIRAAYKQGPLT
jgi:hypothetical protein